MDTVDEVPKKRGRPKKEDVATPEGIAHQVAAEQYKQKTKKNAIIESYYELYFNKLLLCKRTSVGTHREYVGNTQDKDPKRREQLKLQIERLQKEGRLRMRV